MAAASGSVGSQIPRWGLHAETAGTLVLWQRKPAGEIAYTAQDHGLVVALSPIARRETRLGGERGRQHLAPAGSINIIPAGADHWGSWGADKETAYLALAPQRLATTALEHFDRDAPELVATNRPLVDRTLLDLSRMLTAELRSGGLMTELYLESLVTLIMIQMLRHYSSIAGRPVKEPSRRGGLAAVRRRAVLDYMAEHCAEPVTLAELAALAGLAPSSFIRAFRAETGITPHRHLLALRVQRAQRLIAEAQMPLAQVALAAGFSSQSHMTTAFGRLTGTTPAKHRTPSA